MSRDFLLTRESARLAQACYSDGVIASLVPEAGLHLREVASLPIPTDDRVWAIISAMGYSYAVFEPWIISEVEMAIRAAMTVVTNPIWRTWAQEWLSGEDRKTLGAAAARRAMMKSASSSGLKEWVGVKAGAAAEWAAMAAEESSVEWVSASASWAARARLKGEMDEEQLLSLVSFLESQQSLDPQSSEKEFLEKGELLLKYQMIL